MAVEVQRRVKEEMEKRDADIELEVQKRLLVAKQLMEKDMQNELEKQKQMQFKAFLEKEVLENVF